jgi:hypothetical protein
MARRGLQDGTGDFLDGDQRLDVVGSPVVAVSEGRSAVNAFQVVRGVREPSPGPHTPSAGPRGGFC